MRKHDPDELSRVFKKFLKLPRPAKIAVMILVAVFVVVFLIVVLTKKEDEPPARPQRQTAPEEGYLFCFWNVENLFDDRNERRTPTDEHYDNEYANDKDFRETKLRNLSKILLAMNGGNGPDILAAAEIESERAAELLRERLNNDLPEARAPYSPPLFVEQRQGRHIAPAILTRLPVRRDRTAQLGERSHRILRAQIDVNGQELTVIASHWKSRVQRSGARTSDVEGRAKYADVIYGEYKAMFRSNPEADLLICGDFNDDPSDDSVLKHLRASRDPPSTASGSVPSLFNLAAGKDPRIYGTLWYSRWHLFDQIVTSPGLLDTKGWTCMPDSFRTIRDNLENKKGHPWRFVDDHSGKHTRYNSERGYSDHFPVTVRLKVRE